MSDGAFLAIPLLLSSTLSAGLAVLAWRMSDLRSKAPFVLLLFLVSMLSFSYLMELVSVTLEDKLFWNGIQYISNVFIPPVFLVFTLTFVGRSSAMTRGRMLLLSMIPALTLAILWTNEHNNLFYEATMMLGSGFMASYDPSYGPWFYVHIIYSFSLLGYSFLVLLGAYLRSSRMHRKAIRFIMVAGLLPVIGFILGLVGLVPIPLTFLLIMSFIGASSLIFLGTFRYELFDVMPLALDTVVEWMKDGAIVLDSKGRIVHVNPSGAAIMGRTPEKAYAARLSDLLPDLKEAQLENALASGVNLELSIPQQGEAHFYDLQVTAMTDQGGQRTGLMLILRDVDGERRMKDSLRKANTRLNLMSMLIRHDTLNQVSVIRGYSELISTGSLKSDDVRRYGERIKEAVKYIEHQFVYAQQYQGLGRSEPVWQWMQFVLAKAKTTGAAEGLEVRADLGSLSVLADPMLEKVFTIFLDDTRRVGKGTGNVQISYRKEKGACIITYRDDSMAAKRPSKDPGPDQALDGGTGMGLFVARQIMEMSGGSLNEVATDGAGTVYEIIFPQGSWKEERVDGFEPMGGPERASVS